MGRRKLPTFLNDREPEILLRATGRERDRILLLTLLYTGLRVAELVALKVSDLDFTRRTLFVRQGKGARDRVTPIPKKLWGPLKGWVAHRVSGALFPSREGGGHMSTRAVQLIFKRVALAAGLPEADKPRKYHPHALRHCYATRLLNAGASIYEVSRLLGHSGIAVTETYLHATADRLAEVADRI